jgi:methyl coenzyme M reductase system subunit A2
VLKVSHLVKDYSTAHGPKRVLDGVSFSVADAEVVGITGRSGSGKSTLLKILRGVESFESGEIEIDGQIIKASSGKAGEKTLRKATAIHLQRNFGLWGGPAIENVIRRLNYHVVGTEALPLPEHHTYQELYDEALSILQLVHLDEKALHSTDQLSGGEKQRLVLARQIAAKPKILLLDEPVTRTGPDTKQEILDVI